MIRIFLSDKTPLCDYIVRGLKVVMENNYFLFNGSLWKQTSGTAMGAAVAPSYATLFLGIAELTVMQQFQDRALLYNRFMDDGIKM